MSMKLLWQGRTSMYKSTIPPTEHSSIRPQAVLTQMKGRLSIGMTMILKTLTIFPRYVRSLWILEKSDILQLMKCYIIIAGILIVTTSTMGSALPSNAIPYITAAFDMTDSIQDVLPISIFLAGYVVGPIFFGPLSETYGRKIVLVIPYFLFTLITMACALAPSWPALVVFRFFGGVFSSSPLSVVPGCYADIFDDPVTRGRAMALFMGVSCPCSHWCVL